MSDLHQEDVSKLTESGSSSASKWTGLSSFLTPQSWPLNRASDSARVEHVEAEIEIEYSQTPMNNYASPWRIFHQTPLNKVLPTVESDASSTVPSDEENENADDADTADFFKAYIASMETFLAANVTDRQTISAKGSRRNVTTRTARVNALGQIQEKTPKQAVPHVEFENQSKFFVDSELSAATGGDSLLAGISCCTNEASIETVDASNRDKKLRLLGLAKTPERKTQVLVPQAPQMSQPAASESMSGTATTHRDDSTGAVMAPMVARGMPGEEKKPPSPPKKKLKTVDEPKKKSVQGTRRSLYRKMVLLVLVIIITAIAVGYSTGGSNDDESTSQAAVSGSEGSNNAAVGDNPTTNDGNKNEDATGDVAPGSSPSDSNGDGTPTPDIFAPPKTKDPTPFPTPPPTFQNLAKEPPKTKEPTPFPTPPPSPFPTRSPTARPTAGPSPNPTRQPTTAPTPVPPGITVTYVPGKLTKVENGIRLSEGLKSRIIARSGFRVPLTGNENDKNARSESKDRFHVRPDGAEVFYDPDTGGWAYVSNSEAKEPGKGGVGAIYFDKDGEIVDYQMILQDTTWNCAGGKTPWNTWVSCEEVRGGTIYQVDPFGRRAPEETTLGKTRGGFYESFAYDIRDSQKPRFFATEDHHRGTLRRFTPDIPNWNDPWTMLHGEGLVEYMHMTPDDETKRTGTFKWMTDFETARDNAFLYFQHSEGLDVADNQLYAVCKYYKELFIFNLDDFTYTVHSTVSGVFDGMPDQMKRLVHDEDELLYICEEGGSENGVHARNSRGWFFTILESAQINDETTGLAFSPDNKHMYVAFQEAGVILDVWREDGHPFNGRTLNVKYHEISQTG